MYYATKRARSGNPPPRRAKKRRGQPQGSRPRVVLFLFMRPAQQFPGARKRAAKSRPTIRLTGLVVAGTGLYGQHAHKADAETAIRQYSISCPGIDYQGSLDHTRKELFQAVQKLWQGSYNKIYSRPVTRNQRCFYFKTMAVSEFHIIVPTIGTILRDTHRPLPVGAKALSGQIFYSSYEGR